MAHIESLVVCLTRDDIIDNKFELIHSKLAQAFKDIQGLDLLPYVDFELVDDHITNGKRIYYSFRNETKQ